MDWETILKDNLSTILVLIGTLGGASIALLASYLTKREEKKIQQLALEKEYQHKYFTERIDFYVTETIHHMESAYWTTLDVTGDMSVEEKRDKEKIGQLLEPKMEGYIKKLHELREKQSQVRARVEAFDDKELSEAYKNFQLKVNLFRTQGWDNQWDYLKQAIPYATIIFKKIGPRRKLSK